MFLYHTLEQEVSLFVQKDRQLGPYSYVATIHIWMNRLYVLQTHVFPFI